MNAEEHAVIIEQNPKIKLKPADTSITTQFHKITSFLDMSSNPQKFIVIIVTNEQYVVIELEAALWTSKQVIKWADNNLNTELKSLLLTFLTLNQILVSEDSVSILASTLPDMSRTVRHPVIGTQSTLMTTIINLNDFHQWTREQIADWLESLDDTPTFRIADEECRATVLVNEMRIPQSQFE